MEKHGKNNQAKEDEQAGTIKFHHLLFFSRMGFQKQQVFKGSRSSYRWNGGHLKSYIQMSNEKTLVVEGI